MNEEIVCIRCRRLGHVEDLDFAAWEASGETEPGGLMIGVCPGCVTREEEAELVEDWDFDK